MIPMHTPRPRRRLAGLLSLLVAAAMLPLAAPTPASAEGPVTLTMVPDSGELRIRGNAEAATLASPTTLSGQQPSGGDLTGLQLSTPPIHVVQHVTSPIESDVFIDISLGMAAPGSGNVDSDGNVRLNVPLRVDLHVEVGSPPMITADCTSAPVGIVLDSTAPYDEDTRTVTVRDPNFTIPAFPTGGACSSLVAGAMNDQLAGSGHSLELTLEGDLERSPAPTAPTVTTVTANPTDVSAGDPVELTATVAPADPASTSVPSGSVEFRDGTTTLATATVDADGVARATVTDIPVGNRTITARYGGDLAFDASTATTAVRVAARPALVAEIPSYVRLGADPTEFDIEVTNSDLGNTANLRVDTWATSAARLVLEIRDEDGGDWHEVAVGANAAGAVPIEDAAGSELAPGETRIVRARVSGRDNPASAILNLRLKTVDPSDPTVTTDVQTVTGTIVIGADERRESRITLGLGARPGVTPVVAQQGTLELYYIRATTAEAPTVPVIDPRFTFEVDGTPIAVRGSDKPIGPGTTAPVEPSNSTVAHLPANIGPGQHVLTIKFLGTDNLQPTTMDVPFTVVSAVGSVYECHVTGGAAAYTNYTGRARVVLQGNVPGHVVAGRDFDVRNLSVDIHTDRTATGTDRWNFIPNGTTTQLPNSQVLRIRDVSFDFGESGDGSATSVTRTGGTLISDPDDPVTRAHVGFGGEHATLSTTAAPGTIVPVQLEEISFSINPSNTATCSPVDEPAALSSTTVTGTTLTVEADEPVRAGDSATLRAEVAPADAAGQIVFRDGDVDVAILPVSDGVATATVSDLTEGTHRFTARFRPSGSMPATTSEEVTLEVGAAARCSTMLDPGNGAVVRLVYLELMGRCPDAAGYRYWTDRLDAGASPQDIARQLGYSNEALGRQVDRAYRTILDRGPDAAGRAYWIGRLRTARSYTELLAFLGNSAEAFNLAGGTNTGFVTRIYDRLLHRAPDPGGLAHWVAQLDAGTSRGSLVRTIARLNEPLSVLVDDVYRSMLDRAPTAAERTAAVARLRRSGDLTAEYVTLMGTPAFRDRAQTFPNPS